MRREQISFPEARMLAEERARQVLRGKFPKNASDVFEEYIIEDEQFWLFFRNRNISIPECPTGEVQGNFAFAVGKHGLVLSVKDTFDDREKLEEQIKGLSGYFAKRDDGNAKFKR
jgi:hypothetical protein